MREILAYMCSVRAVNQSCIKWKVSQFQKWLVDNSVSYYREYLMFCVNNNSMVTIKFSHMKVIA